MNDRRILIGEISSYKAIVVAKFIKKTYKDLYLIGYDYKKFTNTIHTKYCDEVILIESPKNRIKEHLNSIVNIIKERNIDLFIPVNSGMYGAYIHLKHEFGNAFNYVGDIKGYEQLHNKSKLTTLASSLGIRIPKTYSNSADAKIPFVVKPINLSSAKGVRYVFSDSKRNQIKLEIISQYIIQEYIQGIGCGYSVFASEGRIITGYGHLRYAEYPVTGGSSVYRTSYYNPGMIEIAEKLLNSTKWSGFAMFEFKLTPSNELILIEVNPRIWGSINQGLQNGINYFESLFGKTPDRSISDVNTYLSPLFYQAVFKYLLKLHFRPLLIFLKNIGRNRADISLSQDYKGFLSTILRKLL